MRLIVRAAALSMFVARFFLALLLILGITAGGIGYAFWIADRAVNKIHRTPVTVDEVANNGPVNYLIIGSDSRAKVKTAKDQEHFGSASQETGQRSDTIMIAHIDPKSKTTTLVSFPRDLWVNIRGIGMSKINAAFNYGPQRVIDTIKDNFGVPINHFLEVDFFGFQKIVNTIGSVHLFFPTIAQDTYTGLFVAHPGCVALKGKQALAYVRSRHYQYKTVYTGSWHDDPTADLGRIRRQQYFMRSVVQEAIEHGARHWTKLNTLVDETVANLEADTAFDLSDFRALARAFHNVDPSALVMKTIPADLGTSPGGQSILNLNAALAAPIFAELRGKALTAGPQQPLPKIPPSSVRVSVLNGSGVAGAAGTALTGLTTRGFQGAGTGDAPRFDYPQTEVQYATGHRDQARLVLAYLGGAGKLVQAGTPAGSDVVVVLGHDFVAVSSPTAGSGHGGTTTSSTLPANPGTTPGVTIPVTERGRPLVGCG